MNESSHERDPHGAPGSKAKAFEREFPEAGALLRRALKPGEKIKLITTGWRSSFVDDVFLGLPTLLANRTLIVGTDTRLLLIHTSMRGLKPRGYLSEVPRSSVMGSLKMPLMSIFTTGGTIRFLGVPLAGKLSLDFGFEPNSEVSGTPSPLCPACFVRQETGVPACLACGAAMKTPMGAGARSLLLPGWGDAWLDSRALGAITLTVAMFFWFNVVAFIQAAAAAGPGQAEVAQRVVSGFLGAAGLTHVFAAGVSWVRARHGLREESRRLQ